jgi:hypothetical protein
MVTSVPARGRTELVMGARYAVAVVIDPLGRHGPFVVSARRRHPTPIDRNTVARCPRPPV